MPFYTLQKIIHIKRLTHSEVKLLKYFFREHGGSFRARPANAKSARNYRWMLELCVRRKTFSQVAKKNNMTSTTVRECYLRCINNFDKFIESIKSEIESTTTEDP